MIKIIDVRRKMSVLYQIKAQIWYKTDNLLIYIEFRVHFPYKTDNLDHFRALNLSNLSYQNSINIDTIRIVLIEPLYIDYHYPFQTIQPIYGYPQEFDPLQ